MSAIGVLHGLVVNVNFFVADLDFIARHGNDPFYKIFLGVFRKFEYHDIPLSGVLDRDKGEVQKWNLHPVNKFIYQDMIPNQKGRLHGTRGNFKRLYDKGADKKGKDDGDEDRLSIFPQDVLFSLDGTLGQAIFLQFNGLPFFKPKLVSCLTSLFKKYGWAIKPFSLLRDHFRDVSFVPLNHARSASVQALRRNRSATTRA